MLCLKMPARDYDAIVVGASFGGLAVARQLRGEVLLLDRNEVGTVQTSACGTPLWVPETLGVSDSVLQVHDRLLIRTPTRTVRYDLSSVPFCTFDYRAFCQGLLAQCRVRFLRTSVSGIQDGAVVTGEGRFTARVIVDCSGWRRAITGGAETEPRSRHHSFGLETHTPLQDEGLTFLLDRRLIPQGLGWIFPVGSGSLIGLGSYVGRSKLKPALERLLRDHGMSAGSYHGTYFPNRLLRPTADQVFPVGHAPGQCSPSAASAAASCSRSSTARCRSRRGSSATAGWSPATAARIACSGSRRRWRPTPRLAGSPWSPRSLRRGPSCPAGGPDTDGSGDRIPPG